MPTITFLTAGVPFLVALYFTFKVNSLSKLSFAATLLFLAILFIDLILGYKKLETRTLHKSFFLFFIVLTLCSVISGVRTDIATMVGQLKELSGVFIWCSVFLITYYAVENRQQLLRTLKLLDGTGIAISLSVYASFLLGFVGIRFGDVQGATLGTIRAFGPLGDQVGFVILLFVFRALLAKKWPLFAFHLCAMLATGTRGALTAFAVGFFVNLIFRIRQERSFPLHKLLKPSLVALAMLTGLLFSPLGKTFIDRLINPAHLSHGFLTRTGSMYLGYLVFKDHALTGVGFNGFRDAVWDYSPGGIFDILIGNYIVLTANQYIQTAVDGGVLSLTVFLFLLAHMSRNMLLASREADDELAFEFKSFFVWTLAILIGNQTSVWLGQHSIICHYLFVLAGLTERALALSTRDS